MPIDPTKPLLKIDDPGRGDRARGSQKKIPSPAAVSAASRDRRVGPKFTRLARALSQGIEPLTLRDDPTALAPETLLVFELSGSLITFARAVEKIGLRIVAEEPGAFEDRDEEEPEGGQYYLTIPDVAALEQLLSLWNRFQR